MMQKGSFLITVTKRIPTAEFSVLEYEMHPTSWGSATVYIQQKQTEAHEPQVDSDEEEEEN